MPAIIQFRLTGGASNTNPNNSLGGVSSSNQLSATPLNNLFDDVQPAEAVAGRVEYRAIDLFNSGDATAVAVKVHISSPTTSAQTEIDLGVAAATGSSTSIANETTAPAGITFSHPNSGAPLTVIDIPNGQYVRLWVRRTVNAGATNLANDTASISVVYA